MMKPLPIRPRFAAFVLVMLALVACGDGSRAEVRIVGMQTGVTRQQFQQMPDSARLESEKDDSRGEAQGVAVEVVVTLDGQQGARVPLDYTLHDARNSLPFVSRRIAMQPDAPRWSTRGHLWLPVPAAGTYYVQLVLADSTGREPTGPRTEDFTIR